MTRGPGSPGPEDRSPSPRLPAAGTQRARTRLSPDSRGCRPPAGHSPWTQDGQHSPSTNQGSAHVAGGQLIWWQTVLNFYKEKQRLCHTRSETEMLNKGRTGRVRRVRLLQRRGDISALSWSGSLDRDPLGPPHGAPSPGPSTPSSGTGGTGDVQCPGEWVTEWANKETERAAVLRALTLPRGLC